MIQVQEQGLDNHYDNQLDCNFVTATSWAASLPLVTSPIYIDFCVFGWSTSKVILCKSNVQWPGEVVDKVETKQLQIGYLLYSFNLLQYKKVGIL